MKEKEEGFIESAKVIAMFILLILGLLVLYVPWQIFAFITNLVGHKGIRNNKGKIQCPVVYYEHPDTKRQFTFIAVMHIAEPEYFASLQKLIDSFTDHKVLFEGTGRLSPQEEESLTPKERVVQDQFHDMLGSMKKFASLMSLQFQKDGLAYPSHWINNDVTLMQLIKSFVERDITPMNKSRRLDSIDEDVQILIKWVVNAFFNRSVPIAMLLKFIFYFSRSKRLFRNLIVDWRNDVAVKSIRKHLIEGNVATIWGAEHLKGIEQQIIQDGFRKCRSEWYTTYRVRNYSLLTCIKEALAAAKTTTATATALKK